MKKLREYTQTQNVKIVDAWECRLKAILPFKEAVAKYGDCYVQTYLIDKMHNGTVVMATVWVIVPGVRLGYGNSHRITIPSESESRGTFIGKRSGDKITVAKMDMPFWAAYWANGKRRIEGTMETIVDAIREECG